MLFLLVGMQPCFGLNITVSGSNSIANHQRFSSGTLAIFGGAGPGDTPVANTNLFGVGKSLDFSGVGWTNQSPQRRHITMITDQHFVAANHFQPSGQVAFLNRDGVLKEYTIGATQFFITDSGTSETVDLYVGKLTTAIPASDKITAYPILDRSVPNLAADAPQLILYGKDDNRDNSPLIGLNDFEGYNLIDITNPGDDLTETFAIRVEDNQSNGEAQGETGDSGGPSFILYNDQLTLAGIHSAIDTTSNPDATFDASFAAYRSAVETILTADGGAVLGSVAFSGAGLYNTIVPIPEPRFVGLFMGLLGLAGVWVGRRGRRASFVGRSFF